MSAKAIVVLSGGQDSTTCLFWAINKFGAVHCITFDYGQRHRLEIEAAKSVVKMARLMVPVTHEIIAVPNCLISKSPLTSDTPLEKYENPEQMEGVIGNRRELTFVPMRNALFLTIAANRAESMGIPNIVTGVCQMDNANYDDCRQVFIDDAENYINTALGHDHRGTQAISIHTPLMDMDKAATCWLAKNLPGAWAALAYSHTSYDGCYPPIDNNHSNVLRADGFAKAGLPDPLVLRAFSEDLMDLPQTSNYDEYRAPPRE
jgi:7-cyano-7-deazaguanine synthase